MVPVRGPCPSTGPWPILVVGPGRCGSSTVARLLHTRLGVCMGYRFQMPDEFNEGGYFEDKDLQWANGMLLGAHKRVPSIAAEFVRDPKAFARRWKAYTEEVIRLRRAIGRPWGIKDPMICQVLETYGRMMPDCRIIRCHRPAERIAASFVRMYSWDPDRAVEIVLDREAELDEYLPGATARPVLGLSFAERREDDELVGAIDEWLKRTSDHADSEQ